jgi:3-oxoacyl-[acyl-carrier-protein] synthase-3
MFPATATLIQNAIGATSAGAFDVNAACTGFLSALNTGSQFIGTGAAKKVLVVGAETLSRIIDWEDRTTCVLFGDGAGAVVLEPVEDGGPGGIASCLLRSDGAQAELLYAQGPASARPNESPQPDARIIMDGRGIFRSAVTAMSREAEKAINEAGLTVDDIALCVPHQANIRILNAMAKSVGLPVDRVYVNLDRYGNTSSATIPIALAEAAAEGRLQPGDNVLLAAFGGGLSWGAMVLQWSGVRQQPDITIPRLSTATVPATR